MSVPSGIAESKSARVRRAIERPAITHTAAALVPSPRRRPICDGRRVRGRIGERLPALIYLVVISAVIDKGNDVRTRPFAIPPARTVRHGDLLANRPIEHGLPLREPGQNPVADNRRAPGVFPTCRRIGTRPT